MHLACCPVGKYGQEWACYWMNAAEIGVMFFFLCWCDNHCCFILLSGVFMLGLSLNFCFVGNVHSLDH